MYEAIFQTTDRPFRATPDERFYYPYDSVEQARQTLARVVRRAEGPAMVMGGSGLGKTMLAQVIAEDLADLFDVVKLYATRLCSRRALLQSILFELQLPYRDLSEGELRLSLMNRMERSPDYAPSGLLLVVDEAHTLPIKLLEELRLITNFSRSGEPRARLILVGSLALEDIFARPELDSFNQRLAARCYLQPMNRQHTHSFIAHQLRCIGAEPSEVITRDALDAVYAASEGIPRLANQVMDHALVLAITCGQSPISAALIEEAWSDLQQLPAPWHGSPASNSTAPIEFGTLEEDDIADETPEEVQRELPVTKEDPPLLETMPRYEFIDLGIQPENQLRWDRVTEAPRSIASMSHREQFSFFDAFEDVGHSATNDCVMQPVPVAQLQTESSGFTFIEIEPTKPAVAKVLRPAEPEIAALDEASEPSEPNEISMLIIHEDQPNDLLPAGNSNGIVSNWWDFSQTAWDPILENSSAVESLQVVQAVPEPPPLIEPTVPSDPFGEDFDEEFAIETPMHGIWANQQKTVISQPQVAPGTSPTSRLHSPEDGEREALDQIVHMQHALEQAQHAAQSQSGITFQDMEYSIPVSADSGQMWQVDTVNTQIPSEEVLHEELEDLISQLNFSAFSMESESVEQISIDYMRMAAPAPILVSDRVQSDNDPPIYSMHEPVPEESASYLDDDREMLIVEEDIPLSMRLSSVPAATIRTDAQSYGQLFTKLRN